MLTFLVEQHIEMSTSTCLACWTRCLAGGRRLFSLQGNPLIVKGMWCSMVQTGKGTPYVRQAVCIDKGLY